MSILRIWPSIRRLGRVTVERISPAAVRLYRDHRERLRALTDWEPRIADVMACPDNNRIPRDTAAGTIRNGFLTMHNGLRVQEHGYYGWGMTALLQRNQGVHEPQEELVFSAALERLPAGSTMLECGAYWGFYSMWFKKKVPKARVWLIEPDSANIQVGKQNFGPSHFSV